MAQYARPDTDITVGIWSPSTGTTLEGCIDEVTYNDGDYIISGSNQTGSCYIQLSSVDDPSVHTGHTVRFRARQTGGNPPKTVGLTVYLIDSTYGTVASYVIDNLGGTFAPYSFTLSETQAGYITSYSDLQLQFEIDENGGAGKQGYVSWAELEVPDASGANRDGSITLAGTSTLTVVASVTHALHNGSATLAGTSTLTPVASVTHAVHDASATMAGTSTLTVVASVTHALLDGAVTIAGTSTLTVAAYVSGNRDGAVTMAGTSTLTVVASVTHATLDGAVTLSGTSTLTAVGSVTHAVLEGSVTLLGTSTLTAVASVTHAILDASITMAGTSTLTVAASIGGTKDGAVSIVGTSTLTVVGAVTHAVLSGEISITAVSFLGTSIVDATRFIEVSGAGSVGANGIYEADSYRNGKPWYWKQGSIYWNLYWSIDSWVFEYAELD